MLKPLNYLVEAEGKKIVKTYQSNYELIIVFDDDTYFQASSVKFEHNPDGEIKVFTCKLSETDLKQLGFNETNN